MSFCKFTDDSGNTYFLSSSQWLQPPDPGEYFEAIEILAHIDSSELFKAEQSLFFQIDPELQQRLTRRLGRDWENIGHTNPVLHPGTCLQPSSGALPGRWPLILDAIYHGDIRLSKIAAASKTCVSPVADNRALLRVKIRQALAAIVSQEKAEATQHTHVLGHESRTGRALIYTGAFFTGLWSAGNDFAQWLKEVNDVLNPLQRTLRGIRASHIAMQRNSMTGENPLSAYQDEVLSAEKRELVQVLGFDPSKLSREQFQQAIEFADLIWEDPALQDDLRRFAKDYVQAQHPIELTEFSGAAAFEILFTLLLAAITGGAGLAASAAGLTRHFARFRKVGDLLIEFGEQAKTALLKRAKGAGEVNSNKAPSFMDLPAEYATVTKALPTSPSNTQKKATTRQTKPATGTPKEHIDQLNEDEREKIDAASTFVTKGVSTEDATDWILNHPDGNSYYNALRESVSESIPDEQVFAWAIDHVRTGSDLPKKIELGEALVKLIPEGSNIEGAQNSPFLTTKDQLAISDGSGRSKWDSFGLPMKSDSYVYDIYELPPQDGATGYVSTIAPTEELDGKYTTKAGLKQVLVPNKGNFGKFRFSGKTGG